MNTVHTHIFRIAFSSKILETFYCQYEYNREICLIKKQQIMCYDIILTHYVSHSRVALYRYHSVHSEFIAYIIIFEITLEHY